MTADEVTKAKERRWLRQLAEAVGEVILAEVPEGEREDALLDFLHDVKKTVRRWCPECAGTLTTHRMDCSRLGTP